MTESAPPVVAGSPEVAKFQCGGSFGFGPKIIWLGYMLGEAGESVQRSETAVRIPVWALLLMNEIRNLLFSAESMVPVSVMEIRAQSGGTGVPVLVAEAVAVRVKVAVGMKGVADGDWLEPPPC